MDVKLLTGKLKFILLLRRTELRAKSGFQDGQFPLVDYVINNEGCTQKQLAQALHITPASVATTLPRMENAGLIVRRKDKLNHKNNYIFVTEKGKELYRQGRLCADNLDDKMYDGFTESQLNELDLLLTKVINNVTNEQTEVCPELYFRFKEKVEKANVK